jgi:hypothetical protein
VGFFLEKEYVGTPQQALGFAMTLNMWDHARCVESDNLHHHPQMIFAIGFGLVTTLVLDRQAHVFS